jgi:hypothetical protein
VPLVVLRGIGNCTRDADVSRWFFEALVFRFGTGRSKLERAGQEAHPTRL